MREINCHSLSVNSHLWSIKSHLWSLVIIGKQLKYSKIIEFLLAINPYFNTNAVHIKVDFITTDGKSGQRNPK